MSITFREFVEILEGKRNKNFVTGTHKIDLETGDTSHTLKPANPNNTGPLTKSDVLKRLKDQGGIGRKSVEQGIKQREKELKKLRKRDKVTEGKVILGKGETYGSEGYQDRLEKKRKETTQRMKQEAEQRREKLRQERVYGSGIRGRSGGKDGWFKDGKFTPDADT